MYYWDTPIRIANHTVIVTINIFMRTQYQYTDLEEILYQFGKITSITYHLEVQLPEKHSNSKNYCRNNQRSTQSTIEIIRQKNMKVIKIQILYLPQYL